MVARDTCEVVFAGGGCILREMPSNVKVTAALLPGEGTHYHPFSDSECIHTEGAFKAKVYPVSAVFRELPSLPPQPSPPPHPPTPATLQLLFPLIQPENFPVTSVCGSAIQGSLWECTPFLLPRKAWRSTLPRAPSLLGSHTQTQIPAGGESRHKTWGLSVIWIPDLRDCEVEKL